jgi:thiol-disulfide isomerase/thioredoxin
MKDAKRLRRIGMILCPILCLCWATIGSAKGIAVGQKFPAMNIPMLNSAGTFGDSSLKGKVVIVDFWASWCGPCKVELPALSNLYKKYKSQGLEVVGINLDDDIKEAQGFVKQHPVVVPLLYDGKNKAVVSKIDVQVMPTSFVLDRQGNIRSIHKGFVDGDIGKFEKEITALLKGN